MASAPVTETHINPTTTATNPPTEIHPTTHARQFDLKVVRDAFVNCIQPDNTLILREYVRAYDELCV